MTTGRTLPPERGAKRDAKASQPRPGRATGKVPGSTKVPSQLGPKLARYIVAAARGRVTATALDIERIPHKHEPADSPPPMQDDTVRETLKRRWKSTRPYEGASTDAIVRKLEAGALTAKAADLAMQELRRRGYKAGAI